MNSTTIICSNCKAINPASNLYCQSCGRPLIPASVPPPAAAPSDMTMPVPQGGSFPPPPPPASVPEYPPAQEMPPAAQGYPPEPAQIPPQGYGTPQGYPANIPPVVLPAYPASPQQDGYPPSQGAYPAAQPSQPQGYPPAGAPPQYYQAPAAVRPPITVGPKLEQLGARVDGWADVIGGEAEKAEEVEKAFIQTLTERMPDGAKLTRIEYTSLSARRAYQVYSSKAGAVAVYIGTLGKDLLVSWDEYVVQKPRWLMLGILGAVAFVISFLHAITLAYNFGTFFLNWIFDTFSWLLLVLVGGLIAGKILYGSIWAFFVEKADDFAVQDLGGMAIATDQTLRKVLADLGIDSASLRSKHSFRAGDAEKKI